MFIQSKRAFKFQNGSESVIIPANFVGSMPDGVKDSTMFKWAEKSGDITYVGQPPTTVTVIKTPAQLAAEAETAAAEAAVKKAATDTTNANGKGK
jgi:hypothetical protein